MDRETFEALVNEALDRLPEEIEPLLANVEILIEDEPDPELLQSMGMSPRRDTLFGLYRGVPLSKRGAWFGNHLPDTITLFYRPLTRAFITPERIRREIERTVVHEVAHFVGMNESQIRQLGY